LTLLAAAALALGAVAAAAQNAGTALPSDMRGADEIAAFRDCRVAVFYHLDGPQDPDARLPREYAEALLSQIHFVMSESLDRLPPASLADADRRVVFTERFMLDFAGAIPEQAERFADTELRERKLIDCVAILWDAAGAEIDSLLAIRRNVLSDALGGVDGAPQGR
jgi:hypothetical protein